MIRIRARREGNRIRVEVLDNGKGLPGENRQRLLEPYMTTREKGTGLGLAIVKKIVEDHGGHWNCMMRRGFPRRSRRNDHHHPPGADPSRVSPNWVRTEKRK